MVEASQTTTSPAGIWAIIVVAVVLLVFWLSAILLADRSQVRASGRARLAGDWPASSGTWVGGSVPGERATQVPEEVAHEPIGTRATGTQGRPAADESIPPGETPTRADIPAQPTAAEGHEMPRQRTGDADRAARSRAGQGTPDDEEPGR
jgi:hypothetical protein